MKTLIDGGLLEEGFSIMFKFYKFTDNDDVIDQYSQEGIDIKFPYFDEDILPFLKDNANKIDRIYYIDYHYLQVTFEQLKEVASQVILENGIIKVIDFNFNNKKFVKFLAHYGGIDNEFNLFIQSGDLQFLKDFYLLFPKPLRSNKYCVSDLYFTYKELSAVVSNLINSIPKGSFLISSHYEDQEYCIFADVEILEKIAGWD